ncbi:MAG: hypothetical protein AB7D27_11495 [Desulfomicrobium sp.]
MTVTKALWVIHLFATCPDCASLVDLADEPDFWLDHTEQDVRSGRQLDVTCPACASNFEVVTE